MIVIKKMINVPKVKKVKIIKRSIIINNNNNALSIAFLFRLVNVDTV